MLLIKRGRKILIQLNFVRACTKSVVKHIVQRKNYQLLKQVKSTSLVHAVFVCFSLSLSLDLPFMLCAVAAEEEDQQEEEEQRGDGSGDSDENLAKVAANVSGLFQYKMSLLFFLEVEWMKF